MSEAQSQLPAEHPIMIAWDSYKKSSEFKSSKHWALVIVPRYDHPGAESGCVLLPFDQRERLVEGSLWAAFLAGYKAAREEAA